MTSQQISQQQLLKMELILEKERAQTMSFAIDLYHALKEKGFTHERARKEVLQTAFPSLFLNAKESA